MDKMTMDATLVNLIFYNPTNYYFVGKFNDLQKHQSFVATGYYQEPVEGQDYQLIGHYISHPKYGTQVQIQSIQKLLPSDNEAIIRFLSGSNFPTIGKKSAQSIIDTLGQDCLTQIKENPNVLEQVSGLSKDKKAILVEGISQFDGFNHSYIQLMKYGLPPAKIALIQSHYKNVEEVLEENCFLPYYEIYGFGYKSACLIAQGLNMDTRDPRFLEAFVYEKIRQYCMYKGDTFITLDTLSNLLKMDDETLTNILSHLQDLSTLTIENNDIYPFSLYQDEKDIARLLQEHQLEIETIDQEELDFAIKDIEFKFAISYDSIQKEAISTFFSHSMMVLNGGPGTGKTTIIKGILELINMFYPDSKVQLCAPTGRASNRMSQLSSHNAKTIHSLLKWNMDNNTFGVNEEEPLDCDFIVIDECSMVDTHVFASLLKALPSFCRIILIGDEDQLESVGPGKVLQDILDSNCFPVIRLEKIYRQKNGSGIALLAQQIREEKPLSYSQGVNMIEKETMDIIPTIRSIVSNYSANTIQILAPMYAGMAGIDQINKDTQELLNPYDPTKPQIKVGNMTFRVDDKVMLLKNRPDEDVYNGDIGMILDIFQEGKESIIVVDFENQIVEFTNDQLYNLKHAYCASIHKSQGCEFDSVICIVDPSSHTMLNKRLLYTAISRSKKELFIIGNQKLLESSVKLKPHHIRQTRLKKRIQALLK